MDGGIWRIWAACCVCAHFTLSWIRYSLSLSTNYLVSNRIPSAPICFSNCKSLIFARKYSFASIFVFVSADEVVAFEHGEKAVEALTSLGFQNITFKSYEGYCTLPFYQLNFNKLVMKMVLYRRTSLNRRLYILLCRLGHYTIPEETEQVCKWLTSVLDLEGTPSDS